jgi:hypothetical protein
LVPGLFKICNLPSIPSEVRTQLVELAEKSPLQTRLQFNRFPYPTLVKEDIEAIGQAMDRNENIRVEQSQGFITQAMNPEYWFSDARPEELLKDYWAELARLQNDLILDQEASTQEVAGSLDKSGSLDTYRAAIEKIPNLILGLRDSRSLKFCDFAERIELIALSHCKHSKAKEWMGLAAYQSLTKLLSDDQARDESRRRALARAWWESKQTVNRGKTSISNQLDGYFIQYASESQLGVNQSSIPSSLAVLRGKDLLVSDLWKLLQCTAGSEQAADTRERIDSQNAYSSRVRLDDSFVRVDLYGIRTPAETWRGGWEVVAKKLILVGGSDE